MKEIYEAPQVQVINIEVQGVIAASVGPLNSPPDIDNVPM